MASAKQEKIRQVVAYFCEYYPHKKELSKARLTKMVYLADWRSAICHNTQITEINWEFNYYGPYVDDVIDAVRNHPAFKVLQSQNMYGELKEIVQLVGEVSDDLLIRKEKEILWFVIQQTARMYWSEFISLIYSTYPIVTQSRFSLLNLVALAQKYNEETQHSAARACQ